MDIVDPSTRDAFREEQIRTIKAEVRREFAERIRAANTRQEKKELKALRKAEIAKRIAPLIRERRPLPPPGHCRECAYNLKGNVSGVCPECGTEINPR